MTWHCCYLALGANLGEPIVQLDNAIDYLRGSSLFTVEAVSSYYHSAPYGPVQDQPDFVNCVVRGSTCHSPFTLLALCHSIESYMGRKRHVHWGARTIDVDILLFDQVMLDSQRLTIPHKDMFNRDFVIIPLLEVLRPARHNT